MAPCVQMVLLNFYGTMLVRKYNLHHLKLCDYFLDNSIRDVLFNTKMPHTIETIWNPIKCGQPSILVARISPNLLVLQNLLVSVAHY